jgi:hypothetical protein
MKRIKIYTVAGLLFTSLFLSHAQESDSLSVGHRRASQIVGIALPAAMITYGALSFGSSAIRDLDRSTRHELLEDNLMWYKRWDDWLQFSPAAAAFGMKLGGMKSVHRTSDMLILYALSNVLEGGIVYTAKHIISRERPDGSNNLSFPSGHTATAFVAAEFLHQEYGDQSVWISIGGYGMASLIGIARVYNNKHWVSDVVAGAGIGILSTKIVYLTHPCLQKTFGKKGRKYTSFIIPTYNEGKLGLSLTCIF